MPRYVQDLIAAPQYCSRGLMDIINVIPNTYGRLNQLNLFPFRGSPTTYVTFDKRNKEFGLISTRERGGENNKNRRTRGEIVQLPSFHYPLDFSIYSADLQNRVMPGAPNDYLRYESLLEDELFDVRQKHAQTLEFSRINALNGKVIDADGSVLLDMFTELGFTQQVVNMQLNIAATNIRTKTTDALRLARLKSGGETVNQWRAFCGKDFFNAYISHGNVEKYYLNYTNAARLSDGTAEYGFDHNGVIWEEYYSEFSHKKDDGTIQIFKGIADDEAFLVPIGTSAMWTYNVPPDDISVINQAPSEQQLIHITSEILKHGAGIEHHTESNFIALNKRPEMIVKLKAQ
jgi:hypothetical protein